MVIEIPQCEDLHPYPVSPVSITTTLQQNGQSVQMTSLRIRSTHNLIYFEGYVSQDIQ